MTTIPTGRPEPRAPERGRDRAAARGPSGPAARGPSGPAARGPSGPADRAGAHLSPPSGDGHPASARLCRLAAGFAQAFLEVEAGRRSRAQLDPVLCPLLAARLATVWVRSGPPGHVVHARGSLVAPGRYEAVVVVRRGERFGAVGVALQRRGRTWLVTEAARPEDGVLPQPPTFLLVDGDAHDEADLTPVAAPQEVGCGAHGG